MRFLCVAALLLFPFSGAAQSVYKCKGMDGEAVYQSFPCAGGKGAEKIWTGSYRQPTNEELWARYNRDKAWQEKQHANRIRRASGAAYGASSSNGDSKAQLCRVTRNEYNRVQADFKLNRNIDLLRRLEADIYKYCK
jgi:hypothetical protein